MIDDKTLPAPRPEERQLIQSYGAGQFRVSNVVYRHPILVMPERTVAWQTTDLAGLMLDKLAVLIDCKPAIEILLVGCGTRAAPVPAELRQALRGRGIVVDAMDTGAACRTYNVLLAESRRVAAALLPVG